MLSSADTTVRTELTQHIAKQFDNPLNDLPLPISCSDLVMAQSTDPTLKGLFDQVLPVEVRSAAQGYCIQDQLLVRKWTPHSKSCVGNAIV